MNIITEADRRHILGLYDRKYDHPENHLRENLAKCKFTLDGKHVLFENNIYSTETGEMIPLTEKWTVSDTFHAIGDVASAGIDFVFPGSGAVIDVLNGISYLIEAQFYKTDPKHQTSLYVMAAVTFAFVAIPGALQSAAVPLKYFVKTGKGASKPLVKKGLQLVGNMTSNIVKQVPSLASRALKTRLGRVLLGKRGATKIALAIEKFTMKGEYEVAKALGLKNADELLKLEQKMLSKEAKLADDLAKVGGDYGKLRKLRKLQKWNAAGVKIGRGIGKLTTINIRASKTFFKNLPQIAHGGFIMKKFGFQAGKTYGYAVKGGKITEATIVKGMGNNVIVKFANYPKNATIPINEFIQGTIGSPWAFKGYTNAVPLFVKLFARSILPDGSNIDYAALEQMADLDPNQTSMDSLNWLRDELAEYQGNLGAYTVNTTVTAFQNALTLLGYKLSRFGVDGKFGPETQEALKQFQIDNKLESSSGKMDRLTASRLALMLRDKNVPGSQDLQNTLNTI